MPRNSLPPFLKKLRDLADTLDPKVAGWAPDGLSFQIHDNTAFEIVLKEHFKGNIQTFVRQLHFYGFRKFENDKSEFCFAHENFTRDRPHLIFAIKRKTRGETLDGVVTNAEVRGIGAQINQLDTRVEGIKRDMESVLNRLGFEVNVGLGSYDVSKKQRMESAGDELIAATRKQGLELMKKAERRSEKSKAKAATKVESKVEKAKTTVPPSTAPIAGEDQTSNLETTSPFKREMVSDVSVGIPKTS